MKRFNTNGFCNPEKHYTWNIAAPFNIDMSLSEEGIERMFEKYKDDRNIELDTKKTAEFIYFYTNGYPFLASRLCKIIDEDLNALWNEETMIKAVKKLLLENNTLFNDLVKNIESNKELKDYMFNLIINGVNTTYNIYNPIISITDTYGYCIESEGGVKTANRIFEQFLYDYFTANNV